MVWTHRIRQLHRWVSVLFTAAVIAVIAALTLGEGQPPPAWVTYAPLPPLFLLFASGAFLFMQPYVARWRSRGRTG